MKLKLNRKIAQATDDISDIYEKVREYIEDERFLKRFDKIMDNLDTEEDMEEFFEDVVLEYLCDELSPEGYSFGIHARTGDIGFWKINPDTKDLDLPYTGMPKSPAVRLLNNSEEELEDEEGDDIEEEEIDDEPDKGEAQEKEEGVAEVLDKDGEVVAHTSFRESTPEDEEKREVG